MAAISLCMIVKNEEKVLERCLEGMRGLVDEIIVVDTGSEDRTKEIASRLADRVEDFVWKDDFSAARNASFQLAGGDFCMWMDADDVLPEEERERFLELKRTLEPETDMVIMEYAMAAGGEGRTLLSYPRERLIRRGRGFRWRGRVHEAIEPSGNVRYSEIVIEHRKSGEGDPDRNLRIYEKMRKNREAFDARARLYYGMELSYHGRYEEAAKEFEAVAADEGAWEEYRVEACIDGAVCMDLLKRYRRGMEFLAYSFLFDAPRAEACCEMGRILMETGDYRRAVFWYETALRARAPESGFRRTCFYRLIPWLQLCVCWDRLGDREKAYSYHCKVREAYPDAPQAEYNEAYFAGMAEGVSEA